ncbi:MAG: c-type cytochrome domain-containing protein [Isosphaeraceae bacterium]
MKTSWLVTTAWLVTSTFSAVADDAPTYERDVRPVLVKRCTVCHNAKTVDEPDVSAGLALDSYDAVLKGVADRPVVSPGKSAESPIVTRLTEDDEEKRMPLFDKPLSDSERGLLIRWVDAGAPRGEPRAAVATVERKPRRLARSLDVTIPIEAKVPANTPGFASSGAVTLALRVGPLPSVTALEFRGDGRLLAVGTHGAVALWDLHDGRPAEVLGDLPGPVHALAFSGDGKRLAVGTGQPARSGLVRVYAVPGGTVLHEFEGHADVVFGLAFRPDGGQLASASFDQTVRLWNLAIGRAEGVFRGHSDFVYDVGYDRDGKSLWSVGKDQSVKRFDGATLKELRTYSGHNDDVLALAVAPRGGRFVSAGHEPQLRWWEADGEKPFKTVGGHSGPVQRLTFSGDGRRLISASGDGTVRLWDGESGNALKSLPGTTDWQYAAALSSDGKRAAAGGWDGLVRVWDADAARLLGVLIQPPAADPSPGEPSAAVEWLAVAPSGPVAVSPGLAPLLRWRVGGEDAPGDVFMNAEALAKSLRGEPVTSLFKNP